MLFKKFAGIDVFDIEVDETDPKKFIEVVRPLEPTFGGINLEDIKAPECFEIEEALRARMKIPVFHDDQHGTAIIVGAAVLNGLELARQEDRRREDLHQRGRGRGDRLPQHAARARRQAREHLGRRQGRAAHLQAQRRQRQMARQVLPADSEATTLGRGVRRRRHLPRPLGRGRAEARDAEADGEEPAGAGAGQPEPRDHAGGGEGGAARRHGLHRPVATTPTR